MNEINPKIKEYCKTCECELDKVVYFATCDTTHGQQCHTCWEKR